MTSESSWSSCGGTFVRTVVRGADPVSAHVEGVLQHWQGEVRYSAVYQDPSCGGGLEGSAAFTLMRRKTRQIPG
jgi:hypothetical protein